MENTKLKVSFWYYLLFWMEYSLLSIGTGAIMGIMVLRFFFLDKGFIVGTLLGVASGQIFSFSYFNGGLRGKFENKFLKRQLKLKTHKALSRNIGWFRTASIFLSECGEINWSSGEEYDKLLAKQDNELIDRELIIYRAGIIALKKRKYEKAISLFDKLNEIGFDHIVCDLDAALAYERLGNGEKSLEKYEIAHLKAETMSGDFADFITEHIERIKTKGPAKKPKMPGLRHSGMGR